jgi:ABC-type sugar transport system substrate-binding protein
MKTKKLVILLAIVLAFALSLAGCGGGSDDAGSADASASDAGSVSSADADTSAPDASASDAGEAVNNGPFKIAFLNAYIGNTWRAQLLEEAEKACEELKTAGLVSEYEIASVNDDSAEQLNQINQLISKGVDAIILDPVSPTAVIPVVKKAQEAGIIVVIEDNAAACEGTYMIGNSHEAYTGIPMEWMTRRMEDLGLKDMVFLEGLAGSGTEVERNAAADAVLKNHPDINVVARAPQSWSATEAQKVMSTLLSTNDNIQAVYGPEGQEGVLQAYENAGKELPLMNMDYTKSCLEYWKEHEMDSVTIPSAPTIGANSIKFAIKLLQGKEVDESLLLPNPMDENMVKFILLDPPYTVVTTEEDKKADYFEKYPYMELLTIDEALELCKDKPSTYMLDIPAPEAYIDSFFKK